MPCIRLTVIFLALVASSSAQNVVGDCADVYDSGTGYCQVPHLNFTSAAVVYIRRFSNQGGCGDCFNGNGRSSNDKFNVVKCPIEDPTGYYCNPEGESFACMDWTFGSSKIKQAEDAFNQRV